MTDWIRAYRPTPEAPVQLVCLPHAGGSAPFFHPLAGALAPAAEVLAVQYPGRQERRSEPLIDSIDELAGHVTEELLTRTGRPVVLFGHSLGGLLAFEVARLLGAKGHPPAGLIVSGRRAPHLIRAGDRHLLADRDLLRHIATLGGTDPRVLADEELIRMALTVLRADYRAVETHRHEPGPPLGCPVTVLTGRDDPEVTAEDAQAWRRHTTADFEVITFPGGHFYLVEQQQAVIRVLSQRLARWR
ncbi:thioesterase II family protein [Actinoplanes teichomyceticus]|uniref:Surfactin synthase thioesterase subunit n=1 Tax=Actinoplanes teichomyceticus TaxID=1867 RepID=A0A561WBG1_ACTTI|nr:alpha/beta fold hydrolase [Actinoplanes teichomyceticus]TWG21204.1 surfactin synthase thioesterase subunit [Actinoplanes teichomyceticus]GIF15025.1 thioesterase [Actinoplanes teichomyceticus]